MYWLLCWRFSIRSLQKVRSLWTWEPLPSPVNPAIIDLNFAPMPCHYPNSKNTGSLSLEATDEIKIQLFYNFPLKHSY